MHIIRTIETYNKHNDDMKNYLTMLLLLLLPAFSFGQEKEGFKYTSKEEDAYYQNRHYKPFEPLSKEVFSNYKDDFFGFEEIDNYAPYCDTLSYTPFQDSIEKHCRYYFWHDSLRQFIGGIDRYRILRYEKQGRIEAFVYEDSKYVRKFSAEPELWVAYSSDGGESWEYYYTGIVQRQPIFVKWYSKLPLFNAEGDLQIEACLLRQMSSYILPFGSPKFNVPKDGLLLTLDLVTLRKDSDGDGLTDIVEARFRTDPKKADTDGDGIPDNLDLNPRFALPRTEKTVIMEAVIEDYNINIYADTLSDLQIPGPNYATDTTETVMIVSNSPDIQSIQPKSHRIIILTEEEYEFLKEPFDEDLPKTTISPLFKVDDIPNALVFRIDYGMSAKNYFVVRIDECWALKVLSGMID